MEAARKLLATGRPMRLSELRSLQSHAFRLLVDLLGQAIGAQAGPDAIVERTTSDGLLRILLEPLAEGSQARIQTPEGVFAGRDHLITVTPLQGSL